MNDAGDNCAADMESCVERELDAMSVDISTATSSKAVLTTRTSFSSSNNEVLEAPTPTIAVYEPFVRWLLLSPLEELTSLHATPPIEIPTVATSRRRSSASASSNNQLDSPVARRSRVLTKAQAAFARAAVEAECEELVDLLSMARRERDGIEETLWDLQHEREENRERIALLESRIAKHLQDRDLAIAETYTTEKQITDLVTSKTNSGNSSHHNNGTAGSLLPSFLRFHDKRQTSQSSMFSTKDIEKLQKEIADTKLETALAKTELDTRYYRLRALEKQVVALKLEIAQASALEDDLQASLAQLQRERRSSLDKLQQVSMYSAAAQAVVEPVVMLTTPVKASKSPKRKK